MSTEVISRLREYVKVETRRYGRDARWHSMNRDQSNTDCGMVLRTFDVRSTVKVFATNVTHHIPLNYCEKCKLRRTQQC